MSNDSLFVAPARFDDPAAALARVRSIYDASIARLRDALQRFVAGEDFAQHVRACYPFVRVHTDTFARADSRLSYGFVAGPGSYETTLTRPDLFGDYYLEQFALLVQNHGVALEVGTSAQPIPVHFSFAEHDHIEGALGAERRLRMRDTFDLPNLNTMDDGVAVWWLVPDSPHLPASATLQWRALGAVWSDRRLRASVFGYFGHMVELYTLWVLAPAIAMTRLAGSAVSWAAFVAIGAGALGCVLGGLMARRAGSARIAATCLAISGTCCLLAPWGLQAGDAAFATWLFAWGFAAAGDSPQFSALTANNAPRAAVGSVLTLVNSIGFAISVLSVEAFVAASLHLPLATLLPWLAVGPLLGLWALAPLLREPVESPRRGAAT